VALDEWEYNEGGYSKGHGMDASRGIGGFHSDAALFAVKLRSIACFHDSE
jgi:hypothetical protein